MSDLSPNSELRPWLAVFWGWTILPLVTLLREDDFVSLPMTLQFSMCRSEIIVYAAQEGPEYFTNMTMCR